MRKDPMPNYSPALNRRHRMLAFVAICSFFGLDSTWAQPKVREASPISFELDREMDVAAWYHVPAWSGNLLLRVEDNLTASPLIDTTTRDGVHEAIAFDVAGSDLVNIRSVAAGNDGSILVAGNAFSRDSRRAGFLSYITPDRRNRTLIQTAWFFPETAALAADGTIWAIGSTFDGLEGRHNTFNVLQRYDRAGKMLSSSHSAGAIAWSNSSFDAGESSHLLPSRDRVGWLTNGCQYIEFSLTGAELGRFGPPEGMSQQGALQGVAISGSGHLVLSKRGGAGSGMLALDRESASWSPVIVVGQSPSASLTVLGFDGEALVVSQGAGKLRRLRLSLANEKR